MTSKLKKLFFLGLLLLIAHGLEEIFTGFYNIDYQFHFVFSPLIALPEPQGLFILFQILLWIALLILGLSTISQRWRLRLMIIPAIIFVFEVHHIILAIGIGGYYPGLITAIFLPIVGIFFWRELMKNWKVNKF